MHLLSTAQLAYGGSKLFLVDTSVLKDLSGNRIATHEGEEHQLDGHELVALFGGQLFCAGEEAIGLAAEVRLASLYARQALQLCLQSLTDSLFVDRQLTQQELHDLLPRLHDGGEQVLGLDGLLTAGLGDAHGLLHGLLRFDGKFVEVHSCILRFNDFTISLLWRQKVCGGGEKGQKGREEDFLSLKKGFSADASVTFHQKRLTRNGKNSLSLHRISNNSRIRLDYGNK